MTVECVDNKIKWFYNDKEITYEAEGIEFATDISTSIYIEIMENGKEEYRYVGYDGRDICKYDNNLLTIYDKNGIKHEIQLKNIDDVCICGDKIYVISQRQYIMVYNDVGEKKGLIMPPQGYIYSRFCNGNKLEVICEADLLRTDAFGRVDYKFEYDMICNVWKRKNVVYQYYFVYCYIN